MSDQVAEGGCLCGAVRYRVRGEPLSSGVCHCRSCRRTSGSPMLPWVTFLNAQFEVIQGRPAEYQSSAPVT